MDFLRPIIDLIMKDIVGQPALLVGLIAAVGLILQKKSFATVLAGGVKTTVGYLMIVGGAGMVVGVLVSTLSPLIETAFGQEPERLSGQFFLLPDPDSLQMFLKKLDN